MKTSLKDVFRIMWFFPGDKENKYYNYVNWSVRSFWLSWILFFIIVLFFYNLSLYSMLLITLTGINIGFADEYYRKDYNKKINKFN